MSGTTQKLQAAKGILFDLDNTLYPREKGVFDRINERINEYVRLMTGHRGVEVDSLRRDYLKRFGTTLGGLLHYNSVDPDHYLEFVHDVPVEEMLEPDPALTSLIDSIDLPMVIFTNGTVRHALRVLDTMGIASFFNGICDLASTQYLGKPHRKAFDTAAGLLACTVERTIFIDDLAVNVEAGNSFGAVAIHINGHGGGVGDIQVKSVTDLASVFSPMPWYRKGRDS